MVKNLHTVFKIENKLTELVKNYFDTQPDIKATKVSDRYKKGVSDFLVCVRGIFVAIELKAEKNTASPHQEEFVEEILATGGVAGVCYTLAEVIDLVERARKKINS